MMKNELRGLIYGKREENMIIKRKCWFKSERVL